MVKLRVLSFILLFCILHKCEILAAASIELENVKNNVCKTPACVDAATMIWQSIDPKVAPCDDFYKFACGNFLNTAVMEKGDMQVDRYIFLEKEVREQLKKSIEEPIQPNEPRWIRLTKNFYNACMDTKAIEQNNLRTELSKLKKAGGWPVLENEWDEKKFHWKESTHAMQKLGFLIWYFFDFKIVTDPLDNTKRMLTIDQPSVSIEREMLMKGITHPILAAYYSYMVDIAVIFGADEARAEKELKETLDFEMKLVTITVSAQDRLNGPSLSKRVKVCELAKEYPSIPWKEYFNTLLKSFVVIGDEEVIIMNEPAFFKQLEQVMKTTPKRVLANFLFWKAVQNDLDYLTEEIRNRKKIFEVVLGVQSKLIDRSQECLQMPGKLGLSTGALYVRKNFNPESKKSAEKLAVDIKQQLRTILEEADWMDKKTRTSALTKLENMKNFIGYPEEIFDDKSLDEYYSTVEINPDDYLQAVSNMTIFSTEHSLKELRKPVDNSDWTLHIDTVRENSGAEYFPQENSIDCPAGILQDVFYDPDRPQYLNYAGIGAFELGHEMTRAFDNEGRKFDENGMPKDWWTPETNEKFLQKAACIIQQYDNYNVEKASVKVNGSQTQESNIADNGGVKAAYLAYQNLVKQKGPDPTLPGINYSQSQLFWIQAALTQCAKFAPEMMKNEILNNDNSLPEFNVIGAFANRPEFARDFNCPVGSKMNPVKKCSVW